MLALVAAPFRALAIATPWLRRLFAHTLAAPPALRARLPAAVLRVVPAATCCR